MILNLLENLITYFEKYETFLKLFKSFGKNYKFFNNFYFKKYYKFSNYNSENILYKNLNVLYNNNYTTITNFSIQYNRFVL